MKYCSNCSSEVELKIPEGDNLPRYCCIKCKNIHYQNPKLVTGTIPVKGKKMLLCKRAINPRHGLWTLPAGFLENNETIEYDNNDGISGSHINHIDCDDSWVWFSTNKGLSFYNWRQFHYE